MKKFLLPFSLFVLLVFGLNAQNTFNNDFFNKTDAFLKKNVENNGVLYSNLKNDIALNELILSIETANISDLDDNTKKAFYINAYNLLVIKSVTDVYPIKSVQEISGFFDRNKKTIAGEQMTLNDLEKEKLLKVYKDPRFHFVLVCGAVDCPPITNFAYRPNMLEPQLEKQTRRALNNSNFLKGSSTEPELSQIFDWYSDDFGGNKAKTLQFINKYRNEPIPSNAKISYYNYDWSLNEDVAASLIGTTGGNSAGTAANAARYVVSSAIPKGTTETKLFNNLYTQKTNPVNGDLTQRSTFFTSSVSFLYGLTNRINAGFDLRYRRVAGSTLPSSPLEVLGKTSNRQGITTIGPKIRIAPFPKLKNFSIQSQLWIPLEDDLEGDVDEGIPYIDWNNPTWSAQFFNDFSVGTQFSVFTEIDFWWEDIGSSESNSFNRVSTPATLILSYFPNSKTTLYALTGYSPFWQENYDYFAQAGLGAKYQITSNFEIEFIYTAFTNKDLQANNGQATTYNIGFRYSK